MKKNEIVGIGAALIDLLIEETDDFLKHIGGEKGGMTLVDAAEISQHLAGTRKNPQQVPGGSACNTLVGIGRLGGEASFVGACGADSYGESFLKGLREANVKSQLKRGSVETGRVLSVVTPDAQRTMFTYLGAAAELNPADVDLRHLESAAIVHLEGYLLFNRDLTLYILELLKNTSALVSLDLASFQVVEASRDLLEKILPEHVDIVLANEDEAKAYTGKDEAASLEAFAQLCNVAVVKKGKHGALIARGEERVAVEAQLVQAVDTTGAGDLWASGFLFGLAQGLDLKQCGLLAAKVASEVVQVYGASIPEEGWSRIAEWRSSQNI